MKKYTANYSYTNPNFVIQNLVTNQQNTELLPVVYVIKNILQRGFPTSLSKFLQGKLGTIHKLENFHKRFLFASEQTPVWNNVIKGDKDNNYYPAKDFFEKIIPTAFGTYSFIQSLLIPEIEINEIIGQENKDFINQQVDFYLPQAKLVIEIDGQQHKLDEVTLHSDGVRDKYLLSNGITTIRITTSELKDGSYSSKIAIITKHLERFDKVLQYYKEACETEKEKRLSETEMKTKLLPTAIMRFQILLLELLVYHHLTFEDEWCFNILSHEELDGFAQLAIEDLLIWLSNIWQLKNKQELKRPYYKVEITQDRNAFHPSPKAINIDFSLFKRYTDEDSLNPDVIYVRTDYFDYNATRNAVGLDKNYFSVSTTEPINYTITDDDRPVLRFFLENIFDKTDFKVGQFPIIANALNRKDTIGLLPTGGGKSLCYQLPCLLQPSISFVVCPIKSLMYDQDDNLKNNLVTNVNFITSDLPPEERRAVEKNFEQGRYLFVWISPEKFQIPSFRDKLSAVVANFSVAYAVVDEVHCLSEWGHDFRTSYLNLAKTIDRLSKKDQNGEGQIKFIGLTATASVHVLKDIKVEFSRQKQRLEDENIKSLRDYSRKELQFEVINDEGNKFRTIHKLLKELQENEGFTETAEKAALVFTPHVNGSYGCYEVSNALSTVYHSKVSFYAGSLPTRPVYNEQGKKIGTEEIMTNDEFKSFKLNVQKEFKEDKYQLLVATKAFGMGIDKSNVFYTFHYGLPSSVEALYQEAGRAGRWDNRKTENQSKIAKCYVLHSPETCDLSKVDKLFHINTTFSEISAISDEVGRHGKDIFKQVFLFVQGQNDIEKDLEIILGLIHNYFKEQTKLKIFWNDARYRLNINSDVLQKAIYRLSLLGIVTDWTTNFVDHYEVQFDSLQEDHIVTNVSNYIAKYEPGIDVKGKLQEVPQKNSLEKAIWYLLNWTFENIAYNRKQSLKTLSDWCSGFHKNGGSDEFKRRIDSYFNFTDTTFILQDIAENPVNYISWFDALSVTKEIEELGEKKSIQVYIPQILDKAVRKQEYERLKDSISRFLESSRNNDGLNFLSGFVRLSLNEYEDSDGRERLEKTLLHLKEIFTTDQQNDFLQHLKALGNHLEEEQKFELCMSITKFYPGLLEALAEYYDLAYLLNDQYTANLNQIRKLKKNLYEQLAEI